MSKGSVLKQMGPLVKPLTLSLLVLCFEQNTYYNLIKYFITFLYLYEVSNFNIDLSGFYTYLLPNVFQWQTSFDLTSSSVS